MVRLVGISGLGVTFDLLSGSASRELKPIIANRWKTLRSSMGELEGAGTEIGRVVPAEGQLIHLACLSRSR